MIFEKIRGIVADQLGIEEENITLETRFIEDLNADSLDLFQVIMELEDEFNVKVEDVENIKTIFEEKNVKSNFYASKNRFLIFDLDDYDSLLKELTLQGIIPLSYHTINADLEDYFLKLIGGLRNE